VDHVKSKGRMCDVSEIRNGSVAASKVSGKVEKGLRLVPIEDRRRLGEDREGMREGFTLGQYLLLVDYTSRTIRKGKASVSKELEGIFERLSSSAEVWSSRVNGSKWQRSVKTRMTRMKITKTKLLIPRPLLLAARRRGDGLFI
jgi:hypothetical protein